jgi:chorismate dehydratase
LLFGSIDYLNLLPFQVFLKKHINNNAVQSNLKRHRNVPSLINKAFHQGKVNAAFISSVTSKGCKCTDAGIVGIGKVYSVLLLNKEERSDSASQSSNALTNVLGLKGEVMIGDRALKYYLDGGECTDLSEEWHKKTGLPFVFARLCYHKHQAQIMKLSKEFTKTKVYIPQYILKKEAKRRGILPKDAKWYLEHIHYKIDCKAKQALKIFLRSAKA